MKRRDGRVYIAVDHGITEHPKIERLSDAAFRALVECWCWCSRNETDGRMPKPSWSKRVPVALATELLDGCLAHDRGEYVEMHDYTEHQRTAEEIKALREKRSAAGSKGGLAKAANRVASATADAKQTGSKSVAETETETTSKNVQPRPEVEALCELLAQKIADNGSKRPTVTKAWLDDMRRMLDLDGRTVEEVRWIINWCQGHSFWSTNILSVAKLRKQFDAMKLQVKRDRGEKPTPTVTRIPKFTPPDPPPELADDPIAEREWIQARRREHERQYAS